MNQLHSHFHDRLGNGNNVEINRTPAPMDPMNLANTMGRIWNTTRSNC